MITDLWIENFKGIGKRQHIALRPVTLLFGANSAGKSTVLHALLYLRECLGRNNADPRKGLDGGESVNLGGFANIVHDSNEDPIKLAATVTGWSSDYCEAHYLAQNRHWRSFDPVTSFENKPLDVETHRRGFCSTGISFHDWEPSTTIEVDITDGRVSNITFSTLDVPAVRIWRRLNASRKDGQAGHLFRQPRAIQPMIGWVNPGCGFLYPENYEIMGRGLDLNGAHEAILQLGLSNCINITGTLADRLGFLCQTYDDHEVAIGVDWLWSFDICGLPSEPTKSGLLRQHLTGVLVPLDRLIEETFDFLPGKDLLQLRKDSLAHIFVWLVPGSSIPAGVVAAPQFESLISDGIGILRVLLTGDPVCNAITIRSIQGIWEELDHAIDLDIPDPIDTTEAGLCYLSERQALIDELIRGSLSTLIDGLNGFTYVGPKRSTVPRNLTSDVMDEYTSWGDGLGAWNWLSRCSTSDFEICSKWLWSETTGLNAGLSLEREIVYEIEASVLDAWKNHGLTPTEYLECVLDADEDSLRYRLLDWMSTRSFQKIFLRQIQTGKRRHPQDVGEGVTQVIPVIAACVRSISPDYFSPLVAIEQPELHLHPSLAAKIGDLIAGTMLTMPQRTALIETHSEHLILRILRRIRQTTNGELPAHIPPVKPDDVCVLWVDNLGDGTTFQRLRIDDQGEFIDRWPRGFFSERAEELF